MKISVIIPAYNCEQYIRRCIDSVLAQKGAEAEVIVVNDGSTDGTGEVLSEYGDTVRTVTVPNGGSASARNVGISYIQGDYTMFLDADDYLAENTFETLVRVIGETDADVVKFRYSLVFPDGTVRLADNQFREFGVIDKKDFPEKLYPHFVSGIRLNSVCIGFYRSSLIKGRSFRKDMRTAEDAVFSLGTYTLAQRVAVIPEVLYLYYQTGTGLTGSGIPVREKYRCNMVFASETLKLLDEWGMNRFGIRMRVRLRPLLLTLDKVKRILKISVVRSWRTQRKQRKRSA